MKKVKVKVDTKVIYIWECPYCEEDNETDEEEAAFGFNEVECFNCDKKVKLVNK